MPGKAPPRAHSALSSASGLGLLASWPCPKSLDRMMAPSLMHENPNLFEWGVIQNNG
jgi:hypothetical protein